MYDPIRENGYHTFGKATIKLKDLLPLLRMSGHSTHDESGTNIVICPEGEEWTHVAFNCHSGLLDVLGELIVESISMGADGDDIWLWVKTDDYNWFSTDGERNGTKKNG